MIVKERLDIILGDHSGEDIEKKIPKLGASSEDMPKVLKIQQYLSQQKVSQWKREAKRIRVWRHQLLFLAALGFERRLQRFRPGAVRQILCRIHGFSTISVPSTCVRYQLFDLLVLASDGTARTIAYF